MPPGAAVALGLALLALGGDVLVRGATTLARLLGVTPAVVGLTVVAMGTSLPELVVSVLAAARGTPDVAIANVLGSNIFNVAATLGLTALVTTLPVHGAAVRLEWPVMFVASAVTLVVMRDGRIDRLEGGVFVVSLAFFTTYAVHVARRELAAAERVEFERTAAGLSVVPPHAAGVRERVLALALVVAGGVALLGGGRLLVDGAVAIARTLGVTERIIGLTVVAIGTGMPELVTSLVAAFRGRTDVAVANIIGSNVFNLLGILGVTALVSPVPVARGAVAVDAWWMLGTAALLYPLLRSGMRLRPSEGALLVAVYAAYLWMVLR